MRRHHLISGSIAATVAIIVSLSSWLVVSSGVTATDAATKGTYACFKSSTGQVFLRSTCKTGEKRILINGSGLQGARGYSNFELAQQNGFAGTVAEWLKTLVGPAGATVYGSDGARGPVGATGPVGPVGPAGADGFIPDYGYFIDLTSQTMPAIKTATPVKIGTNVISDKGVTIANGSQITFAKPGTYNVQFSIQVQKATSTSPEDIDIWLSQNGTTVPNTNTQLTITNDVAKTGKAVAAWNFFVTTTAAGEYCELMWSAANTVVSLPYVGPQTLPDRPSIPSVILSVNQIG